MAGLLAMVVVVTACSGGGDDAVRLSSPPSPTPPASLSTTSAAPPSSLSTPSPAATAADGPTPHDVFETYKKALLARDGEAAAVTVSAGTIAYYEEMRKLALTGTRTEVKQRRLIDRLFVVVERVRVPVDELRSSDGRRLLILGVKEGWINAESVERLGVASFSTRGDQATARMAVGGETTPLEMIFRREGGQWRVDLTSLFPAMNFALQTLAKDAGISDDDLIFRSVEAVSGKAVDDSIYDQIPG